MAQNDPKIGELYKHFKGKLYQVTALAKAEKSGERMVVYQALYGDYETYVRPLSEFVSGVDYEKYPESTARYRFTYIPRIGREDDEKAKDEKPAPRVRVNTSVQEKTEVSEKKPEKPRFEPVSGIDPETGVSRRMLAFLDTDDFKRRYELLSDMALDGELNDSVIDNLAAAMDVVIPDGDIDSRCDQLKICIRTRARYETDRLR